MLHPKACMTIYDSSAENPNSLSVSDKDTQLCAEWGGDDDDDAYTNDGNMGPDTPHRPVITALERCRCRNNLKRKW